jgi:hypothetical protein
VLRELGERVHCHHGAADCPRATGLVVFAECPTLDGDEHCSFGILSGDVPYSKAQRTHSRTAIS